MPRFKFTLFRVFYSTSFSILFLVLAVLLLVTPGDAIYQAFRRNKQIYNIFIVGGTYLVAAIIALSIYIARIFTYRRLISQIPQQRIPIKAQDLPRRLHVAVLANLERSARVVAQARPSEKEGAWGTVNHSGWARPRGDLMGVQYASVVAELPGMVESKAMALLSGGDGDSVRRAGDVNEHILLAARRDDLSFHAYLENLILLGLAQREDVDRFIELYERARFRRRGKGIQEMEFRTLMKAFAGLLRGMGELQPLQPPRPPTDGGASSTGYVYEESGYARDEPEFSTSEEDLGSVGTGSGRRLGFGRVVRSGYDTTTSTDGGEEEGFAGGGGLYGYEGGGYKRGRAGSESSGTAAVIRAARGRRRGTNGEQGLLMTVTPPKRRNTMADARTSSSEGEEIEMGEMGRRRLSLRASAGTFG